MKRNDFFDQYKDPRWQKKRLEILNRDEFKCRSCTDDLNTLHVHHFKYDSKLLPWEYEDSDLITLCETCHEAYHYLSNHKTIGFETFSLVLKLYDILEMEAMGEFPDLTEYTNG